MSIVDIKSIHSLLFVMHIMFGGMALVLFWLPVATRKGGLDHIKFGRYYARIMYCVAASGALMALLVLAAPLTIKAADIKADTDLVAASLYYRLFWLFLLYLSLMTFVLIRHGVLVVQNKTVQQNMRSPMHLVSLGLLLLGGLALVYIGIQNNFILHIIFGVLGSILGWQMLRFCLAQQVSATQWLIEHFAAFIGSGISAYTAFISFGGQRLFDDLGYWQLVFWVAPGVIGGTASWLLARKYRRNIDGRITHA
ncbi:MAG: hypothetical protein GW836_18045 [Paraglaciecola sp.]|nr:hypothetical protein [Paraglaciecola sp.]